MTIYASRQRPNILKIRLANRPSTRKLVNNIPWRKTNSPGPAGRSEIESLSVSGKTRETLEPFRRKRRLSTAVAEKIRSFHRHPTFLIAMKNTQARAQRFTITALTWTLLMLLLAQEAAGFWFICRYRDAQKAAKVANAAKERYNEYLSNPRATRAQIEACKQAWDVLRTNTFAAIAEFAQQVPGTSLTGPPNVKELTKDAIKEAIKEVLGDVAALQYEGMPLPLHDGQAGEFTRPSGVMAASLANATVPVGPVAAGQITELSLGYITPQDYDGALGEAPPWARLSGPLIFISGTFTDVAVENFQIGAQNPLAAANPGMLFSAEEIFVALLERPALLRGGFDNGFFSPELLQWVVDQIGLGS
ncbi:MAG: hypothetical protein IPK15_10595 [Verrucomicrobia bacterium]|nr:hypothetical protein [Verrucomicrobiota bacterium]